MQFIHNELTENIEIHFMEIIDNFKTIKNKINKDSVTYSNYVTKLKNFEIDIFKWKKEFKQTLLCMGIENEDNEYSNILEQLDKLKKEVNDFFQFRKDEFFKGYVLTFHMKDDLIRLIKGKGFMVNLLDMDCFGNWILKTGRQEWTTEMFIVGNVAKDGIKETD